LHLHLKKVRMWLEENQLLRKIADTYSEHNPVTLLLPQ